MSCQKLLTRTTALVHIQGFVPKIEETTNGWLRQSLKWKKRQISKKWETSPLSVDGSLPSVGFPACMNSILYFLKTGDISLKIIVVKNIRTIPYYSDELHCALHV